MGSTVGFEFINIELAKHLNFYKIGKWKTPIGEQEQWHKSNNGPLQFPWSNQLYFEIVNGKLVNATEKFRKKYPNNIGHYILEGEINDKNNC